MSLPKGIVTRLNSILCLAVIALTFTPSSGSATPLLKKPAMLSSQALEQAVSESCETLLEGLVAQASESHDIDLAGDRLSGDFQGPFTPAAVVENIIQTKTALLGQGQVRLADGIDVPNAIYILYAKDFIASNKDEIKELQLKFAKDWYVAMMSELNRRYQQFAPRNGTIIEVAAMPGEASQIVPKHAELFPYLYRILTEEGLAKSLPPDLRETLSGRGKKAIILVDGRMPLRRAAELDRQVAQALIERRAASLERELQAFTAAFITGVKFHNADGTITVVQPSIEELFIDASVIRDAQGRSTREIAFWNHYLRTDSLKVVKDWYERLIERHLVNYIATIVREFPIAPRGQQMSPSLPLLLQQINNIDGADAAVVAADQDHSKTLIGELKSRVRLILEACDVLKNRVTSASNIVELVGPAFTENGLAANLPSIPATVRYNHRLGALQMGPLEVFVTSAQGHVATPSITSVDGDDITGLSGAGTNKSNLASLRALIAKLKSYGMNFRAIEAPDRGFGMQLRGHFSLYVEYFKRLLNELTTIRQSVDGHRNNRIGLGRSMGAIELAFMLMAEPSLPLDVIVAQSTALWPSALAQLGGVYAQLRDGSISAIIKQALVDANEFNLRGGALLETAQTAHPEAFETTGAEILFWFGNDDEDYPDAVFLAAGLPVYPELMRQIRDRYFPLASLYPFYNRIKHLPQNSRILPAYKEGGHFVLHNTTDYTPQNMTGEEKEIFRGIPPELIPQLASQTSEAIASLQIKKDLLADGLPGGYEWPQESTGPRQEQLRRERLRLCGTHADGTPVTYFEHFVLKSINPLLVKAKKQPITTESLHATQPGGENMTARISRVYRWGQGEMQRVVRHLKAKGYLPADAPEQWGEHIRLEGRSSSP